MEIVTVQPTRQRRIPPCIDTPTHRWVNGQAKIIRTLRLELLPLLLGLLLIGLPGENAPSLLSRQPMQLLFLLLLAHTLVRVALVGTPSGDGDRGLAGCLEGLRDRLGLRFFCKLGLERTARTSRVEGQEKRCRKGVKKSAESMQACG